MMDIVQSSYLISSPKVDGCPPPTLPEFAFIGRSNVGKSSLINMLCRHQGLAKTSATPGKTQMINHFSIQSRSSPRAKKLSPWYLVDLPGYGYAKVSQKNRKSWSSMIENYLRQRSNLRQIFVLLDSRHEPQKIDLEFINQLGEWQLPFSMIFTKADKVKPGALQRHGAELQKALQQTWEALPPLFITSATT
ncbi:MAG TPA: ribosome biogenesis GTP-binding protein YihA/YsxC, partial [Phnomibacter sp.]|nr:ribosome biogenesis GTP-binding protein YihA/YsxC [Phnomibacter sp.]